MIAARERFMDFVEKTTSCWLWNGPKNQNGYGKVSLWKPKRTTIAAHKFLFQKINGELPKGMELDHLCRIRHCVNPDHLEIVTHRENTLRGISMVAVNAKKTHCKYGHEFTKKNTKICKSRGTIERNCKTCHAINSKKYRNERLK